MKQVFFRSAKAIFHPNAADARQIAVAQYGFYSSLEYSNEEHVGSRAVIRLAARNIYRLYVNGEIVMHGPARTAHGYCRVDEIDITGRLNNGTNHLAVEVIAYGRDWIGYNYYSNDSTLEDGMLIAEVESDGRVLSATGNDKWQVLRIPARSPISERISHSRECIEIYDLNKDYHSWRKGEGSFIPPIRIEAEPIYLKRETLHPTLKPHVFREPVSITATRLDTKITLEPFFYETNKEIIDALPERPTSDCRRTVENGSGSVRATMTETGELSLTPINTDSYLVSWEGLESQVGFIRIKVTCEKAGIIDIAPFEIIEPDGISHHTFNNVTRLHVPSGSTAFVTLEPALARYMSIHFRGVGATTVHSIELLDYSYPDLHQASFQCSNDNINRLYRAARKTLLLNTLDVFMDCPERERGGWLCDSLWTGRAAALMLSDHRIEREMLENFLLTDPEEMGYAFFPEVYPANKQSFKPIPGFTTWSFWLMTELCEFIERTGDSEFRDAYKPRVSAFVNGARAFIGKSGVLEDLPLIFIDWSLSNRPEYTGPVSSAANALYAYMMIALGKTFGEPSWIALGKRVRQIIRNAVVENSSTSSPLFIPDAYTANDESDRVTNATAIKYIPDAFNVNQNGKLISRGMTTEAATYTSLWCELFTPSEAPELYKTVRDKMGPAPLYAKDPMIGECQLFIGLCIRLDLLARQNAYNKMYSDMLAIYEPQLREGPGTLWENRNIDANSRCHGFTAHVGVHLMRDVLGLGISAHGSKDEDKPTVEIAPHICGLSWARGTHNTPDGLITVEWRFDGDSFLLRASLPSAYNHRVILPAEARMLDEGNISVKITKY